jgi:uncharacterized protein (TIGR02246 family)
MLTSNFDSHCLGEVTVMLKFSTMIVVALCAAIQSASILAQETGDQLAAIRSGSEVFVKAFNQADAKAIAALWTEDGEYIDEMGERFVGRDAIEKVYANFFAANAQAKIEIKIDSLRMLSSDTAIENGRAAVVPASGIATGFSQYTVIHVKQGDTWKMASVRDAAVETPASVSSAADLDWLIGTWQAEEHGVVTVSVCSWVAEGRFIQRTYTATNVDGTTSSGIQLVGWNPAEGHVQSWSFSPDGGLAVGIWFPQQDGWVAQMRGISGDGLPTSSVNHLRKLDDQAHVWQSINRSVGGMTLVDTHEVVWKRQPKQADGQE